MDQALSLAFLHEIMVEIIVEYTIGASVKLCDHATSLLQRVGSNIHHLHLARVIESMHPIMVFHRVDDGFGNSINWMKDWHETMMEHLNTHKKGIREYKNVCHLYPYLNLIYVWLNFHLYLTFYTFHQIKLNFAQFALENKTPTHALK